MFGESDRVQLRRKTYIGGSDIELTEGRTGTVVHTYYRGTREQMCTVALDPIAMGGRGSRANAGLLITVNADDLVKEEA